LSVWGVQNKKCQILKGWGLLGGFGMNLDRVHIGDGSPQILPKASDIAAP